MRTSLLALLVAISLTVPLLAIAGDDIPDLKGTWTGKSSSVKCVLSASLSRRKKMQFFFAGGVPWRVVHGIPVSRWIINWERVWPV